MEYVNRRVQMVDDVADRDKWCGDADEVQGSVMSLIGMSPFWDKDRQQVFYCDVFNGTINRYDWKNKQTNCARVRGENQISFCIPVRGQNNQFVCGAGRRLLMVSWDCTTQNAKVERILAELNMSGVRFNTGRCDNLGRLYIGTMNNENEGLDVFDQGNRNCGLYRWTKKEGLQQMQDGRGHVSGIAIDENQNKLYFVDSVTMKIKECDYNQATGNCTNARTLMDMGRFGQLKRNVPYGMNMDMNGNLYCAMMSGGKVMRINTKNRNVDKQYCVTQTDQVTDCCFGGFNMDTMIVTTACVDFYGNNQNDRNRLNDEDCSGFLVQVRNMDVRGKECNCFQLN